MEKCAFGSQVKSIKYHTLLFCTKQRAINSVLWRLHRHNRKHKRIYLLFFFYFMALCCKSPIIIFSLYGENCFVKIFAFWYKFSLFSSSYVVNSRYVRDKWNLHEIEWLVIFLVLSSTTCSWMIKQLECFFLFVKNEMSRIIRMPLLWTTDTNFFFVNVFIFEIWYIRCIKYCFYCMWSVHIVYLTKCLKS